MKRSSSLWRLAAAGGALFLASQVLRRPYSFGGKVVVITGGSRGLGLAMAREFARERARLVLLARDGRELERAAADLRARGAATVFPIPCDVTDEQQVQTAIATIVETLGGIDVLINNAGRIVVGPLQTMTAADFEESLRLHFWAPFQVTRAVLPYLRRSGEGRVVNIASFGGKLAVPHLAPYCAGKFALVGLSDALRTELAQDGVRVTTVCPGLMRTGSHVNAEFKGDHHAEYAWFAGGAAAPGASMSATRAARKIVAACRAGQPQLILTWSAKLATLSQAVFPNLTGHLAALANHFLPKSKAQPRSYPGWESRGKISPKLTRRVDRATEEFNGLRQHPPLVSQ